MTVIERIKYEGKLEGLKEGRLKGIQEGRLEVKIDVAKRMLADSKYPVEEIARILNISVEKILEIKASL